jgi:Tfp pilus assembly protein PilF
MASSRENMFLQMTREFPDAPMGHFSLGKLYVEERRYAEAVPALEAAVRLDANYAAAWVALAEAQEGLGQNDQARESLNKALQTPHGKKDASLQADLEQRLRRL